MPLVLRQRRSHLLDNRLQRGIHAVWIRVTHVLHNSREQPRQFVIRSCLLEYLSHYSLHCLFRRLRSRHRTHPPVKSTTLPYPNSLQLSPNRRVGRSRAARSARRARTRGFPWRTASSARCSRGRVKSTTPTFLKSTRHHPPITSGASRASKPAPQRNHYPSQSLHNRPPPALGLPFFSGSSGTRAFRRAGGHVSNTSSNVFSLRPWSQPPTLGSPLTGRIERWLSLKLERDWLEVLSSTTVS
jgi:hypothetical protein